MAILNLFGRPFDLTDEQVAEVERIKEEWRRDVDEYFENRQPVKNVLDGTDWELRRIEREARERIKQVIGFEE